MKKYQENIFTKIIKKEIKSNVVFENDSLICIHDINPRAKIHVLIIPKKEVIDFEDFINNSTIEEAGDFFKKVEFIAKDILKLKDYKLQIHKGKEAGQEIFHFHLHILGYN